MADLFAEVHAFDSIGPIVHTRRVSPERNVTRELVDLRARDGGYGPAEKAARVDPRSALHADDLHS